MPLWLKTLNKLLLGVTQNYWGTSDVLGRASLVAVAAEKILATRGTAAAKTFQHCSGPVGCTLS